MAGGSDSLAALFRELAQLTLLDEGSPNAFRVRAYERATDAIGSYRGDLGALSEKQLVALDGIGPSTSTPRSSWSSERSPVSAPRRCFG
jgi:DNA polymerase (family 10)